MSDKRQNLGALQEGQAVDEVYLLVKKQVASAKNGKPYGALRLGDPTGELEAKLWEQAEELLGPLSPGCPVRVAGKVQSYNGQLQLVVSAICAAPETQAADLLPKSPRDLGEMWAELGRLKQSVQNPHLKKLLRAFFDEPDFRRVFELAPAAKGAHHAYVHGLLEHTVSVAGLADLVAGHYAHLDRDLLITGALLHDLGKTEELTLGPPLDFTDAGRLEGHVVLGVRMLDARLARIKGFPAGLAGHLRHIIVSHHGQEAFGSPQKPKLPEALTLHTLDDLDAKTAMVRAIVEGEGQGEGHWSNFNRLLERHIYTGPIPWDDAPAPEPGPLPGPLGGPGEAPEADKAAKACLPGLFDLNPPGKA